MKEIYMTLFTITARALTVLGSLFFLAIFLKVLLQVDMLPGYSYLSSYLLSFVGATLVGWGLLMNIAITSKQLMPLVAKVTGIMMLLFALMRVVALFEATKMFPFLPTLIAYLIPVSEIAIFSLLGFIFIKKYNV